MRWLLTFQALMKTFSEPGCGNTTDGGGTAIQLFETISLDGQVTMQRDRNRDKQAVGQVLSPTASAINCCGTSIANSKPKAGNKTRSLSSN